MKTTNTLNTWFTNIVIALAITLAVPSMLQATDDTCSECDGKITTLMLKYNGSDNVLIQAYARKGEVLYDATVAEGEVITFYGFDNKDTLGTEASIYIDGVLNTQIHTSCSVPIEVGMVFGSFTIVDGDSRNGGQICTIDGYVATGSIYGTVYEDLNSNEMQDFGEIGIANIEVEILNVNGDASTVMTTTDGNYTASNVVEGTATITVVETTLPTNATLTAGDNPNDIMVLANVSNNAGTDGYTFPIVPPPVVPLGNICGIVELDYTGYENATINITDVNDDSYTTQTDVDGNYCILGIPEGDALVSVDETTLPSNKRYIEGDNPTTVSVVADIENAAGLDGYITTTTTGEQP